MRNSDWCLDLCSSDLGEHPSLLRSTGPNRNEICSDLVDSPSATARSDLLDGRPGEQQALLADPREADDDLRLVALTLHLEHHALAELGVHDVVADLDPERLGAVLGRARADRKSAE